MAGTGKLKARTISVPSIVPYYTDAELNSEYHAKEEYEQAIEKYGAIYKVVDFSDLKKQDELQAAVREWIRQHYFDGVRAFTVKAVDLHLLGFNKDKIKVGDRVSVEFLDLYKTPVTKTLTCISAQIDLLNPGNSTYKIGIPDTSMSLKHRFSNNRSSTGSKSSSTNSSYGGSGGTSGLYKYYKEIENKAQINADNIELLSQQLSIESNNIEFNSTGLLNVQNSAVIQNAGEIVNVVGAFEVKENYYGDWPAWDAQYYEHGFLYKTGDRVSHNGKGYICIKDVPEAPLIQVTNTEYWLEQTGRKAIHLLDGAAFQIDNQNGDLMTVGKLLSEQEGKISTFEGSALWTQRENITGVTGEYDIVIDPQTGAKTLVIKSGGGMKIRRNNVEYGLYDEDTLTGGILVDKVNTADWPAWEGQHLYNAGDRVTHGGVGYICKTEHRSGFKFDPTNWTEYHAANTKILGDRVDITADQLVAIGVYTDETLTGGMITQKINTASWDGWSKTTYYPVGAKVTYLGYGYICKEAHTSTGAFDESKWNKYEPTDTRILGTQVDITAEQLVSIGVYTDETLTGGMITQKINTASWGNWTSGTVYAAGDKVNYKGSGYICTEGHTAGATFDPSKWSKYQPTNTKIVGTQVDIDASQVRIGSTSNVEAWMSETGEDIESLNGIVADKATIAQLNAQKARIDNIVADYITSTTLETQIGNINRLTTKSVDIGGNLRVVGDQANQRTVTLGPNTYTYMSNPSTYDSEGHSVDMRNSLKDVSVDPSSTDTQTTLVFTTLYGEEKTVTFNRAASITNLTGSWDGNIDTGVLTVSTNPSTGKTYTIGFTGTRDQRLTLLVNGTPTSRESSDKYVDAVMDVATVSSTTPPTMTTRYEVVVPINATAAWDKGKTAGISAGKAEEKDLIRTRFDSANGSYWIEGYENVSGAPAITTSRTNYQLGLNGTTVEIQNPSGTKISNTASYAIPLQNKGTINVNGTYTPSDGYVGISSIKVAVPDTILNAKARFGSSSSGFYIEAYDSSSSGSPSITGSSTTYHLGLNGTTVEIKNSSGTKISNTATYAIPLENKGTVTANGTYTPGNNYIGISSILVNITPTLSGQFTANGNKVTVKENIKNSTYDVQFGGSYSSTRTTLEIIRDTTETITVPSKGFVNIPIVVNALNGGSSPTKIYSKIINNVPVSQLLYGTGTITSNGDYSIPSGKIGFADFSVNITPTLSAQVYSVNSGKVTIKENIKNSTYDVQFGGNYLSTRTTLEVIRNPDASVTIYSGGYVNIPIVVNALNGSGTTAPTTIYSKTLSGISVSDFLESESIIANGSYQPSNGKLGFNHITVNVPNNIESARSRFGSSNIGYYIEAYNSSVSGNPSISNSSVTYKLGLNGNTVQIQNESGERYSNTPTYNFGNLITNAGYAGRAAVVLDNNLTWTRTPSADITGNNNTATVSTTGRTNSSGAVDERTKEVSIYLTQGDWGTPSANKKYVYANTADTTESNRIARIEVNAGDIYTAGQNSVNVDRGTWTESGSRMTMTLSPSAGNGSSQTVTVGLNYSRTNWQNGFLRLNEYGSGSTIQLKEIAWSMVADEEWSGNSITVNWQLNGDNAGKYTVDATDIFTAGQDSVDVTVGTWVTSNTASPSSTDTSTRARVTFSPSAGNGAVVNAQFASLIWRYPNATGYQPHEFGTGVGYLDESMSQFMDIVSRKHYLEQGTWSNNKTSVNAIQITSSGSTTTIATLEVNAGDIYNNGWNDARSYTVNNLPNTSIGSNFDGTYKTISVKYPGTNGSTTLTPKDYTLSLNSSFRPTGTASNICAVELITGSTVVARIDANSFYTSGQNSVNVSAGSWVTKAIGETGAGSRTYRPSAGTGTSATVYVGIGYREGDDQGNVKIYASGSDSDGGAITRVKEVQCTMTAGTWSSNKSVVTLKGGSATFSTLTVDAGTIYTAGWQAYYDSSQWAKAIAANNWKAKIPKKDASGAEDWDCGARSAYNTGGATARCEITSGSSTPGYGATVEVTPYYTNVDGTKVSLSANKVTITTKADRYETGWGAAYSKVSLPGQNTGSDSCTVETPNSKSTDNPAKNSDVFRLSVANNTADILRAQNGSTAITVARVTHNKWNNGYDIAKGYVSMPTTEGSGSTIEIKGPNDTRTGSTKYRTYALANNGNNEVVLYTAVNGSDVNVAKFTHNKWTAGFNQGIISVTQAYNPNNRYVDMLYNGEWTGVNGFYIGDMLDNATNSVTISSMGTANGHMDDDDTNTYTYTYNVTPNPGWYMVLKAKATASNGNSANANIGFRVQRFANELYGSGWDAYMNDQNWGFIESTGEVYRPTSYGTGGSQTWFNVTDYGYTKGGAVSISASAVGYQTARAGQTAIDAFCSGATQIFSSYTLHADGSYAQYYKFKVTAGGTTKNYYFKVSP